MKKNIMFLLYSFLILLLLASFSFGAIGDPFRFGNLTHPTVWVGGTEGNGTFNGVVRAYNIFINSSEVCTSVNGNCNQSSSSSFGSGWRNDSGSGNVSLVVSSANVSLNSLFVDNSNGRIGIGTATPAAKLDVNGDITLSGTGDGTLKLNTSDGADNRILRFSAAGDLSYTRGAQILLYGNEAGSPGVVLITTGDVGGEYITLQTDSTDRLRIIKDGSVGIGTTNPQNLLDVEGSAVIGATYSGTNTAPTNGLLVEGTVGIGTTSPSGLLSVKGDVIFVDPVTTDTLTINDDGITRSNNRVLSILGGSVGDGLILQNSANTANTASIVLKNVRSSNMQSPHTLVELEFPSLDKNDTLFFMDMKVSSGTVFQFKTTGTLAINGSDASNALEVTGKINASGDVCITGGNCLSTVDNGVWSSGSGTIYNTTANVGIGLVDALRAIHINSTIRIEPVGGAPSTPGLGDLYVDSDSNELCFYDGSSWTGLKAGGACV